MSKTDIFINHASKTWRSGNRNLWITASMVRRADKEGEPEWANKMADRLAISTDTVYWYSVAYRAFEILADKRKYPVHSDFFDNIWDLREALSLKHFVLLSRAWKKYEFSPQDAIGYLVVAGEERVSADYMASVIQAEHDQELDREEWMKHYTSVYKKLAKYQNDYKLPEEIRNESKTFMKVLEKYGCPYG